MDRFTTLSSFRTRMLLACALAGVLLGIVSEPARAGRTCEPYEPTAVAVSKGLELGKRAFDMLDASGAEVALIARAGQNLSQYRLRYSHMGFVWRDHPDGRWTVVHELNSCGSATSSLYTEGLGNFFLDDPFRYEALVVIPDVETQRRLVAMLRGDLPQRMHDGHYSVVAFPFATDYQNSNGWVLELMASALSRDFVIADRAAAQNWLRLSGFRPTTLEIPTMTRLGARMFKANVAFDDHPFDRRMAGQIDVVSVESVVDFLRARGVAADFKVLSLPAGFPLRTRVPGT
jgi:hypothetical protein